MLHVTLARGIGPIVIRIALRRLAEEALPLTSPLKLVSVLNRMSSLVAHYAGELVPRSAFYVEHLIPLQPDEARMSEIERNGESRHALRREPLL